MLSYGLKSPKKRVVMSHLTQSHRYIIRRMLKQGYKQIEIPNAIGKDKSVINRVLKRNSDKRTGIYKDKLANLNTLNFKKKSTSVENLP